MEKDLNRIARQVAMNHLQKVKSTVGIYISYDVSLIRSNSRIAAEGAQKQNAVIKIVGDIMIKPEWQKANRISAGQH